MKQTLFDFLTYILPIALAAFSTKLADLFKTLSAWLDARGPVFKQIFVGAVSFVLTAVASKLLIQLTGNAVTDFGLILSAVLPYIFKLGKTAGEIKKQVGA